jgi:hypothetical protein
MTAAQAIRNVAASVRQRLLNRARTQHVHFCALATWW